MIYARIPATSANLGPGFDCMGIALDLWNTFELHGVPGSPAIEIETHGEGEGVLPTGGSNLIAQTMLGELYRIHFEHPGLIDSEIYTHQAYRVVCHNDIPCASGLGSSSTAVLAGLILAHGLAFRHV